MTAKELPKIYDPKKVEDKIYKIWEESGFFNPDNLDLPENSPSYSIVLPPPNVTGTLHMGHAAMMVYQDILIRYKRMSGFRTLWIPGTDHAAIATQTKVEKILKEKGASRHSLGREKFLAEVNKFAQDSHDTIKNQTKKMGSSCDWSREAFTLDEIRNKAVNSVFKLMHEDELIYRGERVINWCPRCHSTLADDEVEHKNRETQLFTFRYWKDFPIPISTTRPETKLGDTAVAVNPKDERYKEFIGQEFLGNFCGIDLKIKIIADRNVEMDFGTGALGVTPAHSMIDWKMAKDNDLNIIKVIDEDGKIKEGFGEFAGLTAFEARKLVVEKIKQNSLLEKEENIQNAISVCYRCGTSIEPLPSLQWFIDVNKKTEKLNNKSIKETCLEAVEKGVFDREKINIIPQRFEKNYFQWMNNLEDWCISRQIWYGHRIPVWYKGEEISLEDKSNDASWERDSDTLDTWFSSGMWTFSTLAQSLDEIKIENGKLVIDSNDFKSFHPTSVLETGYDILFFWVARMIIMTTYAINDIPFQDVYLHGLVLDENGKKMSKSLGNVLDPLDMIEKFGTDAVRLSLFIGSTPGNDTRINEEKIENYRNFVNKLWNISRFVTSKIGDGATEAKIEEKNLTFADKWIIDKIKNLITEVTLDLEKYNFSLAGEKLQEFTKNDFADWYLEVAKFETNTAEKNIILGKILEDILKLWHPFIPFITEEIWSNLSKEKLLLIENWPALENWNEITAKDYDSKDNVFEKTQTIITAIRNLRAENKIEPTKKLKTIIYAGDDFEKIKNEEILIKNLRTGVGELIIEKSGEKPAEALYTIASGVEIYLINEIDKDAERKRISAELENLKKYTANLNQRLSNKEFTKKAPAQIVAQEKERLAKAQSDILEMEKYLEKL